MATSIVGVRVRELLAEFPDAPSAQLARIARQRWPEAFASPDQARTAVRRARGAQGKANRVKPGTIATRSADDAEACRQWGALLPRPEPTKWYEFALPTTVDRWLALFDLHVPYYDEAALRAAVEHGRTQGCKGVLLGGDFFDFYRLSRWEQDPTARRTSEEITDGRAVVRAIDAAIEPDEFVFKIGNHDWRFERYIMGRAPELFGVPRITLEAAMEADKLGLTVVPSMSPIRHGKLSIMHGHEFPTGLTNPVNPARGAFLRAISCVVVGHHHRSSSHTEPTHDGNDITCWSVGCLCDLRPMYRPVANKWNHGFAIIETPRDGTSWRVHNYRIVNGEVV
jgi:hypothetical protein